MLFETPPKRSEVVPPSSLTPALMAPALSNAPAPIHSPAFAAATPWTAARVLPFYRSLLRMKLTSELDSLTNALLCCDATPVDSQPPLKEMLQVFEDQLPTPKKFTKKKTVVHFMNQLVSEEQAVENDSLKQLVNLFKTQIHEDVSQSDKRDPQEQVDGKERVIDIDNGRNKPSEVAASRNASVEAEDAKANGYLLVVDAHCFSERQQHAAFDRLCHHTFQYIHYKQGLAKLERRKASTAVCGNWALLQVVEMINEHLARQPTSLPKVQASLFMGRVVPARIVASSSRFLDRKSCHHRVGIRFDVEKCNQAWQVLWRAFSSEQPTQRVWILHLKNHYALVFALRQFHRNQPEPLTSSSCHRQVLTARKGQKPKHWIAWEEIFELMVSWCGYQLILLEIQQTVDQEAI